jgi:hypothetical protein
MAATSHIQLADCFPPFVRDRHRLDRPLTMTLAPTAIESEGGSYPSANPLNKLAGGALSLSWSIPLKREIASFRRLFDEPFDTPRTGQDKRHFAPHDDVAQHVISSE